MRERQRWIDTMDMAEWLHHGITKGWCSAPFCDTHDGVPLSEEEQAAWDDGEDPCIHAVRLHDQSQQ